MLLAPERLMSSWVTTDTAAGVRETVSDGPRIETLTFINCSMDMLDNADSSALVAAILPGAAFVEATSARTVIAPASKNTTSVGEILSFPVRDTNGFPKQISEFFIRFAGFLCNKSKPKP
jgi:hypothetical protein